MTCGELRTQLASRERLKQTPFQLQIVEVFNFKSACQLDISRNHNTKNFSVGKVIHSGQKSTLSLHKTIFSSDSLHLQHKIYLHHMLSSLFKSSQTALLTHTTLQLLQMSKQVILKIKNRNDRKKLIELINRDATIWPIHDIMIKAFFIIPANRQQLLNFTKI